MTARALQRVFLATGVGSLVLAVGWWWATYATAISYDYISAGQASLCLLGSSDICSLARSLCSSEHPFIGIAYWSASFWIAVASLSGSLVAGSAPKA